MASLQNVSYFIETRTRPDSRLSVYLNLKGSRMVSIMDIDTIERRTVLTIIYNQYFSVYAMISYAQDVRSCRHQLFDVHFSKHQSARLEPCGFCDNCTLSSTDVVTEDIRRDVHSLCTLLNRLKDLNERVTLMKLVEAWKGLGPLRHIALAVRTEQNTAAANNRANKDVRFYSCDVFHVPVSFFFLFHFSSGYSCAFLRLLYRISTASSISSSSRDICVKIFTSRHTQP